ncbi:MAG: succinate dehydrogenase, cytochrome b556 subunit [Paracoccaceae bacterium]|nr:succinate dehydrogenase, cytochrome b556 subunit [Paracoccaceae bacterium]
MADVNRGKRPLSPHLQIYRPQITSILSILHRVTGVGLTLGMVLVVWWFVAAALSPGYFALVDGLLTSWFGVLVLATSVWALWYHALNGVRHLFWDAGWGFDLAVVTKSGIAVLGGACALTLITLLLV